MGAQHKIIVNQHYNDLNPRICGREACESGHFFGPTTRHFWILHFVVSGKGKFSTERGEYEVGPNEMFIIRPSDITYYEADKEDPWDYIWVGFAANIELPNELMANDTLYVPFLKKLFFECFEYEDFSDNGKGYEAFLCSRLWQMFSILEENDTRDLDMTERYIRLALDIIENEGATNITVSDIAARLHLDRSYFSTMFTGALKMSPKALLTSKRMHKAVELLCERGLDVSTVAHSLGFSDVFSFSRAFKQYHKLSPTAYREKAQKVRTDFGGSGDVER